MPPHVRQAAAAVSVALAAVLFAAPARTTRDDAPRRLTQTPAHATNLNPSLSGDGRTVAFESSADLAGAGGPPQLRAYLADASGEPPAFARLADARAPSPALSQDGTRAAFASAADLTGANPDRNSEIFFRDGALLRQLTDTAPADAPARARDGSFRPSLSDDGRAVAFASNRDLTGANPDLNFEVFVCDTAARTCAQITDSSGVYGATGAKLSGDASRVAYLRDDSQRPPDPASDPAPDAPRDLILYERATATARVVASAVRGLALAPGRAVSDDGLRVVYAADDANGASQVFLRDGRNDATRQLTNLGRRAADVPLHPTISGDGSRVAFATRRSATTGEAAGGVDLYVLDLPTQKLARVTDAPARATAEVVSALDDAGATLVYNFPRVAADPSVADEFANTSEIFLARLEARPTHSDDLEILHAATGRRAPAAALAPGQLAHARGANLSLVSAQPRPAADKSLPLRFKGVSVAVNGRPAPVLYVSPAVVHFQIPDATETGTALVAVRNHDGFESLTEVRVEQTAPGVFAESGDGRGPALALDALTQLRLPFDPVDASDAPRRLSIFTTGLRHAREVSVAAGGVGLAVEHVVASPDLPGLDEVHVILQRRLAGAGRVALNITADGRAANETTLHFTGARRPARVALAPDVAALGVGRALRFTAAVFDADNFAIPDAPVRFASSDETAAVVDAAGTARGLRAGVVTIRASAGEVSAEAQLRVHALSLVLNEVLADPPDGAAGDANRDGARSAAQDEFVEIVNAAESDLDLGGYTIAVRAANGAETVRHTFAAGHVLAPGTAAVVFGGAQDAGFDPRDPNFGGALVLVASTGGLSLPNPGATVLLRDPSGVTVEQLTYGEAGTPAGDENQSLTRAPDVTGDFAPHLSAADDPPRAFSPGTRLDATPFAVSAPVARIEVAPASASVRTGEAQQFAVRAFDREGRELAGVIFRWQSSDAGVASVDDAGLARGLRAGAAEIYARARGVESMRATLTVVPPPRRVVRVEVSPASASVNRGGTRQFAARAFDGAGRVVPDAIFAWSSASAAASVDASGLARGAGFGAARVVASTADGAGGTVEAEASLDVRVPVVLNELLADVPLDLPATEAVEGDANRDGVRRADEDEFIELVNASDAPVDISGLKLSDSSAARFTFPAGATLAPGRAAVVFGGGSILANDPAFGGALVFVAGSLGLNDGGDTVSLRLSVGGGEIVILSQSFGTQGGPAAPADRSLARAPDAARTSPGGELVAHTSAHNSAARPYSPGTRADGTPFDSPPLARLEISPPSARLDINATQTFDARAYAHIDGAEVELPNVSFAWEADDAARATLAHAAGASTRATARAAGTVAVRARAGGLEAAAALTINPPPSVLTRIEVSPASAAVAAGGARQFAAQAFDQFDAPLGGVAFDWTSRDPAVAAIDARGLASARRPGTTEVRASAAGVTSRPAALLVTRRLTRVEITPAAAQINRGGARRFNAVAFDQDERPAPDAPLVWHSSDAAIATVDAQGLARGVGAGTAAVNVSAPDGAGGFVSASATLTVRLPLVLSELLADVPPDDPATAVVEGDANRDGARNSAADEFIELVNASDAPVELSGLRLSDATSVRFTFPADTTLAPGRAALIFGGPPQTGFDPHDPAFGGALVFHAAALGLNDGGDAVTLKLPLGPSEFVVFAQPYGTQGGPPAPSNQSLARTADATPDSAPAAGNFAPHLAAPDSAGRAFSPGTRVDGTPLGSPPLARIEIAPASAALDLDTTQTFVARAYALSGGAEVEVAHVSFVWDASDAAAVSLAPTTGRQTTATARAAGQLQLRARAGGREASAALIVNPPPPALTRVELTPLSASLAPGQSRQFTARAFDQYGAHFPVASLDFASSAPAVAAVASPTHAPGDAQATAVVTAASPGTAQLTATASQGARSVTSAPAFVNVSAPPPVPTAGQVVINEALVAFATSATQTRADFVELRNTTDQTLDISGLSVSFRPGGSTTTVRTVTLPGAIGSDTLRIAPRGYFLVVNGTQTFGVTLTTTDGRPDGFDASRAALDINAGTPAPSPCAATLNCFDLNGSAGGIKIEIGATLLDGLAYRGGTAAPPAPFNAFGEGTILAFTSGATNDLIRSPDGTDTNDNAADFRRNGTAASVTPKGPNP